MRYPNLTWRVTRLSVVVAGFLLAYLAPVGATDVTQLVKGKIDASLSERCDSLAVGNEKSCALKHADFDLRLKQATSLLTIDIDLRSRHVPVSGMVLYDDTAHINVNAEINNDDCNIYNVKIETSNEIYKILVDVFQTELEKLLRRTGSDCEF